MPSIRASDGERGGRGDLIQAVRGNENKHFARMPTPIKNDAEKRGEFNIMDPRNGLGAAVKRLQTVVADDAVNRKAGKFNSRGEPKLSAQVLRLQTLTSSNKVRSEEFAAGRSPSIREVIGGALNPEWVEWFMGWPIGWTALELLATDRFRPWCVSHGISWDPNPRHSHPHPHCPMKNGKDEEEDKDEDEEKAA